MTCSHFEEFLPSIKCVSKLEPVNSGRFFIIPSFRHDRRFLRFFLLFLTLYYVLYYFVAFFVEVAQGSRLHQDCIRQGIMQHLPPHAFSPV